MLPTRRPPRNARSNAAPASAAGTGSASRSRKAPSVQGAPVRAAPVSPHRPHRHRHRRPHPHHRSVLARTIVWSPDRHARHPVRTRATAGCEGTPGISGSPSVAKGFRPDLTNRTAAAVLARQSVFLAEGPVLGRASAAACPVRTRSSGPVRSRASRRGARRKSRLPNDQPWCEGRADAPVRGRGGAAPLRG